MAECKQIVWSGRDGYLLHASGYKAVVVPSLGANVVALYSEFEGHSLDILNTPADDKALIDDPYAYGVPVLFPANRVAGGSYCWDGVTYTFPQNYPNGVHIHGVLHNRPWPVQDCGTTQERAWIRLGMNTKVDAQLRSHFPIDMAISLEISVSPKGLTHLFTVTNDSDRELPVGLASHTAFRVRFAGNPSAVRLSVPLLARCTEDGRDRLPDGRTAALDDFEQRIASARGAYPLEKAVDVLYTSVPGAHEAVLTDGELGCQVVYRVGEDDRYWILWNKTAREGFISVEPQTWLSDAMHLQSPGACGALFVQPHSCWSNECSIFVRPAKG